MERAHAQYSHSTYGEDMPQRSGGGENTLFMWLWILCIFVAGVGYAVFALVLAFSGGVLIGSAVVLGVILVTQIRFILLRALGGDLRRDSAKAPEFQQRMRTSIEGEVRLRAKAKGQTATVTFGQPHVRTAWTVVLAGRVAWSSGLTIDAEWTARANPLWGTSSWKVSRHALVSFHVSRCVRCGVRSPSNGLWCSRCALALTSLRQAPIDSTTADIIHKDTELLTQRRLDRVDHTYSVHYQGHSPHRQNPVNRDEARLLDATTHRAYSRIDVREQVLIQDGERVWQGTKMDLDGPGGSMSVSSVIANRVVDGLITETWSYVGELPVLREQSEVTARAAAEVIAEPYRAPTDSTQPGPPTDSTQPIRSIYNG